ncbi:glycosyltransferase family 2 protein [Candidatus Falkowbacteria bacterium]|nr:glycosyltransferase family 2 protein [Candidatus Falkowbacteria bacterium]
MVSIIENMKESSKLRLYQMVPGLLIWLSFLFALIFSYFYPIAVIYFVIAFDLYWVLRVLHFIFYATASFFRYQKTIKINWMEKVRNLANWQRIHHLVYFPTAGEPLEVLRSTFQSLCASTYPLNKMIVVLGGEARLEQDFKPKAEAIQKEFASKFFCLLITLHPDGLPDEIRGKGANANWMGHRSKEYIDELGIPYKNLIVSYFDSDTSAHPQYFAHLTHKFLTHPSPLNVSYQPVVNYNNNIWQAPAAMRVTAFGTIFWLMMDLMRPERLYTFSSHSMSFQALVDVGFWQKNIVTDDSRIFLQCFFHYDGHYAVEPMYIPISMDTVMDKSYWKSFRNLYKQQRRWAWGVEHFPYMMVNFAKHKMIPWTRKLKYAWNLTEGMYSWATAPILIFILGRLPLCVASTREVSRSVIVQNAPFVLEKLMTVAMVGIFFSAIISLLIIPPRPHSEPRWKYLVMVLQWLLLPITLILFGSIPAVEAQTRLALSKKYHLGFFVTPKTR